MSKIISLYLSDVEIDALEDIARDEGFIEKDNKPSLSKAVKHLIRKKIADRDVNLKGMETMLEQIHAMVPQLAYRSILSVLVGANNIDDKDINNLQNTVVKQSINLCGDFQNATYKNVFVKLDRKNMYSLPIDESANKWLINN